MKKPGRRMANCYHKGRPNDAVPIGLGFASLYRTGFRLQGRFELAGAKHG